MIHHPVFIVYQVPELTQEQLAELEELMSEEHFNFVTNMIENMRMTVSSLFQ